MSERRSAPERPLPPAELPGGGEVTGTERRAERVTSHIGDVEPWVNWTIVAVGSAAPGSAGLAADVAFLCAHGYGMFSVPAEQSLRALGTPEADDLVAAEVADHHRRRGLVSDIAEHTLVVAL